MTSFLVSMRRGLRRSIHGLRDALGWAEGLFTVPLSIEAEGSEMSVAHHGEIHYEVDMAFVEGQTLQDILAASCSTAAIYAVRGRNVAGLADVTVRQGRYAVAIHVQVEFTPVPEDGSYVPIFDGAELVRLLSSSQRRG